MFGLFESEDRAKDGGVVLIGEKYRRNHVKELLSGDMKVVAELVSERRVHLLPELSPEVIVLDCASEKVNPFIALSSLAEIEHSSRVVALTDGDVPESMEEALTSLGADTTADIHEPCEVLSAILYDPEGSREREQVAA